MSLTKRYASLVKLGVCFEDSAQRKCAAFFQSILDKIHTKQPKVSHLTSMGELQRFSSKVWPWKPRALDISLIRKFPRLSKFRFSFVPKGVYLHGSVGVGKTMLMDMFYEEVPIPKRRLHFHDFMIDVHKRIHTAKLKESRCDPIPVIAIEIASGCSLLCFDEFQVTDIADAMVIRRLFELLFAHGVVLVCTSNRAPSSLYQNGINREQFIPFLPLLRQHCSVLQLRDGELVVDSRDEVDSKGGTDYRRRFSSYQLDQLWIFPSSDGLDSLSANWFGNSIRSPKRVPVVMGRHLLIPVSANGVALFSFTELCGAALGSPDYLALCESHHSVLITGLQCPQKHGY